MADIWQNHWAKCEAWWCFEGSVDSHCSPSCFVWIYKYQSS